MVFDFGSYTVSLIFSFYNFSKFWSILIEIISLCSLLFFLTRYNVLLTELQDRGHAKRSKSIRDVHELRERIVDERDKLDQPAHHRAVVGEWRVAKETSNLCGCKRRTV